MSDQSKETTACYFVTSYVLVGVYLGYALFARTLRDLDAFQLVMLFCTAPPLAFFGGALAFGLGLITGFFGYALLGLAGMVGSWCIWHGAKYVIYGKKPRINSSTP